MTDKNLLRYIMSEKNTSVDDICKSLGVSESTYYRKINGYSDFYRHEIITISNVLGLSDEQIYNIFFNKKLT